MKSRIIIIRDKNEGLEEREEKPQRWAEPEAPERQLRYHGSAVPLSLWTHLTGCIDRRWVFNAAPAANYERQGSAKEEDLNWTLASAARGYLLLPRRTWGFAFDGNWAPVRHIKNTQVINHHGVGQVRGPKKRRLRREALESTIQDVYGEELISKYMPNNQDLWLRIQERAWWASIKFKVDPLQAPHPLIWQAGQIS